MRTTEWKGIARYARAVTGTLDLDRVQSTHLRHSSGIVRADAYGIYLFAGDNLSVLHASAVGVPEDFVRCYEDLGREDDPLFQRMMITRKPVHDGMMRTMSSSPYWDNLRCHRLRFTMQAPLFSERRLIGTANFARGAHAGPFGADDVERVAALSAYASAAAANAMAHEALRDRCTAAESVVRAARTPIVISAPSGAAVVASRTAEQLGAGLSDAIATNARAAAAGERAEDAHVERDWAGQRIHSTVVTGTRGMVVTRILEGAQAPRRLPSLAGVLTPREVDVFELVGLGLSDAEIADRLVVSKHTVKQHLKSVYRKLGARSRTDALRKAWALER